MTKVGVLGNGKLGSVIIKAIKDGKAPECELVGVASRSLGVTVDDLIDAGAEIIVEAAKPAVLKEYLVHMLERGVDVIPLSTGVFSDHEFTELVRKAAREHGVQVHIPAGCVGGFDLTATFALTPEAQTTLVQYIGPRTPGSKNPMASLPEHFRGTAQEGFALLPSHLNVVMATALASGGDDHTFYETRIPEDGRTGFALEMENVSSKAEVRIWQKEGAAMGGFSMIALSTVSLLNRLTQPISF